MAAPEPPDPTAAPRVLLRQLQELIGEEAVARWCAGLLAGTASYDDPEQPPLGWFGTGAANLLQRGDLETSDQAYWLRVWAARGLLHGWHDSAADAAVPAIIAAFQDDAWRVREMAAKVVRRWRIHAAAECVDAIRDDDVPRVRAAAERAGDELANAELASTEAARDASGPSRSRSSASRSSASQSEKRPLSRRRSATRSRRPVTVDDLDSALSGAVEALRPGADADWSVPAGTLSWSCRRTCAHIADDLIAYAAQLVGQVPSGYLPFRFVPSRGTSPDGLLNLVEATGALLAATAQAAPAGARGFHSYGMADAEGFLALGIGELMVHTHDIAAGLKLGYEPAAEVCERVLGRVCRDVNDDGESPWELLLWATGRRNVPGREQVRRWRWSPAVGEAHLD